MKTISIADLEYEFWDDIDWFRHRINVYICTDDFNKVKICRQKIHDKLKPYYEDKNKLFDPNVKQRIRKIHK